MGKLYAIDNIKTYNWSLDTSEIEPGVNFLYISFTEEAPVIVFKDLRFGFELKCNSNIKQYGMYPSGNINRYIRSEQEYLESIKLNLDADEIYTLFLWAENDGQRFEKEFNFTVPRPEQPYSSWTWNPDGMIWEAPIAYPNDGNDYDWNEETLSWVLDPAYGNYTVS